MTNQNNEFEVLRAHTNSRDGRVDTLSAHSQRVATLARGFAEGIGCEDLATLLGTLHDIGKALPGFQSYLESLEKGEKPPHGPPHAIWGAALWFCVEKQPLWREICLPIAGHHAGLSSSTDLGLRLTEFAKENSADIDQLRLAVTSQGLFKGKVPASKLGGTQLEMRIRFLLSCLSDADFIATEEHFNPHSADLRGNWPTLSNLWPLFESKQRALLSKAKESWNEVQRVRSEVYEDCLKAAELPPGLFRLTVPTGGGKTLSSLGFALRHASCHRLQRIVLAVPYTSITEQSAKVYRDYLGSEAVLEHHSNQVIPHDNEDQDALHVRSRLAAENWDATVVVTTTVQLFESLFARRPGKVRKLHNLARSVIVLDEVQTLPLELLRSTLDALRSLALDAEATIVLCTATQPTFDDSPYLREFKDLPVREIVSRSRDHFSALRRVRYERWTEPISWKDLASKMASQTQALVIVNTRRDALNLMEELKGRTGLLHLSTLLCGAHRRDVLAAIATRLPAGDPVIAVCTQVVEAGVDIDFPFVYRAHGPLDRIVQAAGRCNRSGKPELGQVVIFQPAEGGVPRGSYRIGFDQATVVLDREGPDRLHDPSIYREYFQRVFSVADLDKKKIQDARLDYDYPKVAEEYRFMQETISVVVSYKGANGAEEALLAEWKEAPTREAWRRLQPFLVNLYRYEVDRLTASGWLAEARPGLYKWWGKYDEVKGLAGEALDPADLIQ